MRRIVSIIMVTLALFAGITSCKERQDPVAPSGDKKLAPEGFAITSPLQVKLYSDNTILNNGDPLRFSGINQDSVYFEATFSDEVSWIIEITGLTTGAKKYFFGEGSSISKEDALWYGTHDDLIFFRQNEGVSIELKFYGTSISNTFTSTVVRVREFGSLPDHYLMIKNENQNGFDGGPTYPAFFGFDENGSTIAVVTDIPNTPQGFNGAAMRINGNATDDTFLNGARSGALNFRLGGAGDWKASTAFLIDNQSDIDNNTIPDEVKDPDQVWVNVYVYIPFVDVARYMEVQLKEADDNGKNNIYTDSDDDAWVHRVAYDKVGWKLVSFKYSDTWASPARPFGGNGNKVREPHRCIGLQFNLYSQVNGRSSWIGLDYPIFTIGKPFDPSK